MHNLWIKIRLPFVIIIIMIITLAMARLFSGPEDSWIKNNRGEWVKHGHPAGPPPKLDYQEPISHKVIPLIFLVTFIVPLFFLRKHKPHNRLSFDTATGDIKFLGYFSTALFLFGITAGTELILEVGFSVTGTMPETNVRDFILFLFLGGFAGLCILLGVQFYMMKRNCNEHFQLEKSRMEIMEILEKINSDK